jgi:thimet oligopeptidase
MFKNCVVLIFSALIFSGCGSSSSDFDLKNGEAPIRFPSSVLEIEEQKETVINDFKSGIESVLEKDEKTFENSVHFLNDIIYDMKKILSLHFNVSNLSPDESLRSAAQVSYLELESILREFYFNKEIYNVLVKNFENISDFSDEDKALLSRLISSFENNGISLSLSDQKIFEEVSAQISSLGAEFTKNITNYSKTIAFTKDDLQGLSDTELVNFAKDESGNYIFDPKSTFQFIIISDYADKEETRIKTFIEYYSVGKGQNAQILEKIVQLRAKKAALLGFENYADLKTSQRMAKTSENAMNFINDLILKTSDKYQEELLPVVSLKKQEKGDDAVLYLWDSGYYRNKYSRENFSFNENDYKKYFSMENCVKGMFEIFEEVFDIKINERNSKNQNLWHEDVKEYEMLDGSSGELLGLFYFDLYPRDGKYTQFATSFVYPGNVYLNSYNEKASAILYGNWAKPAENNPSLLTFSDLTYLFHEFGHLMHALLMNSKYSLLRDVSWDFVEVPSQIAERWCFDQKILERFAVNYLDESDRLPSDFIEKMEKSYNMFKAYSVQGQGRYSKIDLRLHSEFKDYDSVDPDKVFNEEMENFVPVTDEVKNQISNISSFSHIAEGYGAGYYSYFWSFAIVHDFASVFENSPHGFMDKEIGLSLRKEIFEPGFSRTEDESIRAFLGRNWSVDAYIKYINN